MSDTQKALSEPLWANLSHPSRDAKRRLISFRLADRAVDSHYGDIGFRPVMIFVTADGTTHEYRSRSEFPGAKHWDGILGNLPVLGDFTVDFEETAEELIVRLQYASHDHLPTFLGTLLCLAWQDQDPGQPLFSFDLIGEFLAHCPGR